jgi:UBX domain-containing protein 1
MMTLTQGLSNRRAPLSLLNVKQGQPVELRVEKKTDEEYRAPPPKPIQVFEGSGNRLGAPAPEVVRGSTTTAITSTPGAFGTATNATAVSSQPRFEVDASKPITTVQVRLADGSK